MRAPASRLLLLLLAASLLAGGTPASAPTVCPDGCEDETAQGCFDCPSCAPTRAPAILREPVVPFVRTAVAWEPDPAPRPLRVDPDDVFHVPRRAA